MNLHFSRLNLRFFLFVCLDLIYVKIDLSEVYTFRWFWLIISPYLILIVLEINNLGKAAAGSVILKFRSISHSLCSTWNGGSE